MARLSSYGRTEVARFERVTEDAVFGTRRATYAFMSDGKVLRKQSKKWKLVQLKEGVTTDQLRADLIKRGFKEVHRVVR